MEMTTGGPCDDLRWAMPIKRVLEARAQHPSEQPLSTAQNSGGGEFDFAESMTLLYTRKLRTKRGRRIQDSTTSCGQCA